MKDRLFPIMRPFLARLWAVTRGLTMGVRGAVLDGEGRILLVKHGYVGGWHMPGGGVEVGETAEQSLARELQEEANVTPNGRPKLLGVFHHPGFSQRDHVLVYVVRDYVWSGPRTPDREITDCRFFPLDALPEGTTPATRRRIAEIVDGVTVADRW
jgi:ADP-ribose pyrophosphatase YjhB (NUDIX family)